MPKVRPLSIPYVQSLERVCLKSLKLLVYEALSVSPLLPILERVYLKSLLY